MRILKLCAVSFTLALICGSADASDWAYVGGADDFDTYIDLDSIKNDGRYLKAWYRREQSTATKYVDGKSYRSSKQLYRIDCDGEAIRLISLVMYKGAKGEGDVVGSESDYSAMPLPVVPDSVGETMLQAACSPEHLRAENRAAQAAADAAAAAADAAAQRP